EDLDRSARGFGGAEIGEGVRGVVEDFCTAIGDGGEGVAQEVTSAGGRGDHRGVKLAACVWEEKIFCGGGAGTKGNLNRTQDPGTKPVPGAPGCTAVRMIVWVVRQKTKKENAYTEAAESTEFTEKKNPSPKHPPPAGLGQPARDFGLRWVLTVKAAPRRRTPKRIRLGLGRA